MKLYKLALYPLLAAIVIVVVIAAIAGIKSTQHEIQPSHQTPYVAATVKPATKPSGEPLWQVLLLGDAGDSTLNPWHPTLSLAAELAAEKPAATTVVMLGDNIYLAGYPNLEDGETEFSAEDKLLVDRLDAQLQIAARSDAELFLVPGNHDWLAEQVDSQAEHVFRYAKQSAAKVSFVPWEKGQTPMPKVVNRAGLSMVFLDSQWLITAETEGFQEVLNDLQLKIKAIADQHPENVILVAAHHPLQTMGPHALYYTSRSYAFFMELIGMFFTIDQDLHNPPYQRLIRGLSEVFAGNEKIIYAAGHEHSLQIFAGLHPGPSYQLVSGAANQSKVSGVGHNEKTQFAAAMEGFMRLSVYPQGAFIEVFSTPSKTVIHQQWLP